jgi:hypothetical protein
MPVLVEPSENDILAPIPDIIECTTAVLPKADKFAGVVGRLSWSAEGIADNASDVITPLFDRIGLEKVAPLTLRTP